MLLATIMGVSSFLCVAESSPSEYVAPHEPPPVRFPTFENNSSIVSPQIRRGLVRRYPKAGDVQWKSNVARGCGLVLAMESDDKEAGKLFNPSGESAASSITGEYPDVFEDWGYTYDPFAPSLFTFEEGGAAILPALKALKIDAGLDPTKLNLPNSIVGWKHTRGIEKDGKNYRPTQATYYTVINADAGMIVAWWKFSPASQGKKQKPPIDPAKDPLPDLQHWSDVAYVLWKDECEKKEKDLSSIRYIFSSPARNPETQGLVARAMDNTSPPPSWSGRKEFTMDTDEGKAILGSPNGRGAAMMLIQHKATMGTYTTIEKVAVFGDGDGETNLLFYVKKG
ncbi:hypothetical protein BCR34DRAFT_616466 [Clohesyomyces aquaticus]|uniref:Uncharacterized protein n=1 Tax=Clohesyomyces aquaticus TaxID=1231657 RepID=A0A1Y1ZDZ3_9PLEO|nr:hypothetical protein BCR34DRAFT_616466 [Clohesyomyces aquaticus]